MSSRFFLPQLPAVVGQTDPFLSLWIKISLRLKNDWKRIFAADAVGLSILFWREIIIRLKIIMIRIQDEHKSSKSNHSGQGQFFYHCNFRFVFDRLQTLKILSNLEGGSVDFLSPFPKKLYHVLIAYKVYLGTSWGLDASYFLSCLNFLMLKGLVELQHCQFCLKVTISCWEWYIKRRKDPFLEPREA